MVIVCKYRAHFMINTNKRQFNIYIDKYTKVNKNIYIYICKSKGDTEHGSAVENHGKKKQSFGDMIQTKRIL